MVLKDTPFYFQYFLHLSGRPLVSEADLGDFLIALIHWSGTPVYFGPGTFRLRASGVELFETDAPVSQTDETLGFRMSGATSEDAVAINLLLGKQYADNVYPVPKWVRERFPPLSRLIETWSSEKIKSEIAGNRSVTSINRDDVLGRELVKRGLDEHALIDLLRQGKGDCLLTALRKAGQLRIITSSFDPIVDMYRRKLLSKGALHYVVSTLMPECGVRPEDERDVVELVRGDETRTQSLMYLRDCSASSSTALALEQLYLSDGLAAEQKKATAEAILRRAAK